MQFDEGLQRGAGDSGRRVLPREGLAGSRRREQAAAATQATSVYCVETRDKLRLCELFRGIQQLRALQVHDERGLYEGTRA